MAKPPSEALKGNDNEPLNWTAECHRTFQSITEKLLSAPGLGFPDVRKSFDFFVQKQQRISLGVLT